MKISVRLSPFLALPMSVCRPAFWDLAGLFLNVHHCVSESPHESFLFLPPSSSMTVTMLDVLQGHSVEQTQ